MLAVDSISMMQGSDEHIYHPRDASGGARPAREGHREIGIRVTTVCVLALLLLIAMATVWMCGAARQQVKAAVRIQAAARGTLLRRAAACVHVKMHTAAARIQAQVRCYQAEVALGEQLHSVGCIQWYWRRQQAWRQEFLRRQQLLQLHGVFMREWEAAVRVQAAIRGCLVRACLRDGVGKLRGMCDGPVSAVLYLMVLLNIRLVDFVIFDRRTRESVSMDSLLARYAGKRKKATSAKKQRSRRAKKATYSGGAVMVRGQLHVVQGGNARSPSSVLESLAGSAEGGFLVRSLFGIGGGIGGRALSFDDDRSDSGEDEAGFLRLQEQIKRHRDSKKGAAHAAMPGEVGA